MNIALLIIIVVAIVTNNIWNNDVPTTDWVVMPNR